MIDLKKKGVKKMKKKANKIIFIFFILSLFNFKIFSNEIKVRITIPTKDRIQLKKYDKIIFQKYTLKLSAKNPINIEFKKIFKNFFFIEFKKAVNKEVLFIEKNIVDDKKDYKRNEGIHLPENINSEFNHALLISICMNLERDERHIISEETDKYGDKKKRFVKKSVWNLKTKIFVVDIGTSKIIKIFNMDKTLNEENETTEQFNFKSLFDITMEKFIRELLKKDSMETRYLLTQVNKKIKLPNVRKG